MYVEVGIDGEVGGGEGLGYLVCEIAEIAGGDAQMSEEIGGLILEVLGEEALLGAPCLADGRDAEGDLASAWAVESAIFTEQQRKFAQLLE